MVPDFDKLLPCTTFFTPARYTNAQLQQRIAVVSPTGILTVIDQSIGSKLWQKNIPHFELSD